MNFVNHSELKGLHAFLGASGYHWINYDDEKLANRFLTHLATLRGTELHEAAEKLIKLGIKLPRTNQTLNMYVNDAIGYKMRTEQVLYYSDNCFGTADTISFRDNKLRIHDLKTGQIPAHMEQLLIYAALFCLEYNKKPSEIEIELRIYQNDEKIVYIPTTDDIVPIMDKIVSFDKLINKIRREENGL
jgi:hypothetical protein